MVKKQQSKGYAGGSEPLRRMLYKNGVGIEKMLLKAVEWYQKLQNKDNQNHSFIWPTVRGKKGRGVEKDDAKAVEWYQKAAER